MTTVQRLAAGIRKASVTAWRPGSNEAIAMRNRNQAEMLADYIRPGDSVLDVGCGTGLLTKCLEEALGAEVMGLDVQDFRVAKVPLHEFDGVSIPFPDRTFDHVVLSFTLHHCQDPLALIQECRRVARRTIVAFEDLPDGRFGRVQVALHVERFRRKYGLEKAGDYRAALGWLSDKAVRVARTPMPDEWWTRFYPQRYLHVYELSED